MNKYSFLIPLVLLAPVEIINAQVYMTVEQAQSSMFAAATSFQQSFLVLSKDEMRQIHKKSGISLLVDQQKFWKVYNGKEFVGYFVLDQVLGKHELITYALAIDTNGKVLSTDILEYNESYGYEVREKSWRKQFEGKTVADKFELDSDIENISGATLSCKHISDGVKRILTVYELFYKNKA